MPDPNDNATDSRMPERNLSDVDQFLSQQDNTARLASIETTVKEIQSYLLKWDSVPEISIPPVVKTVQTLPPCPTLPDLPPAEPAVPMLSDNVHTADLVDLESEITRAVFTEIKENSRPSPAEETMVTVTNPKLFLST